MNLDKFFPTKKDKNEAKEALKNLINSQGWKVMQELLDFDLKKIDNDLKFKPFDKIEEQRQTQDKYAHLYLLRNYPEDIIKELSDQPTSKVELDPYFPQDEEQGSTS